MIHFHEDDVFQTESNQSDDVVHAISVGSPGARHEWEQALGLVECPTGDAEAVHTFRPTDDAEDRRSPQTR